MTLGSSTTPSGDPRDGAAAPDGAQVGLFDDLVDAWLAPTADEDDADDSAGGVPAAVVPPFPISLPLPVIAPAPQAQADAPEAADGECANACAGSSPARPQPSDALAPHMAPGVAIDPASARRSETAASPPQSEGDSAQKTNRRGPSAVSVQIQAAKTAAAGADDQPVRNARELPGLTSAAPSGGVPAGDPQTNKGVDVALPVKESQQAPTSGGSIPSLPTRAATVPTDGSNPPLSAPSVEGESISASAAADAGPPARAADAGLPARAADAAPRASDALVKGASEGERPDGSVRKPAPREAGVPHRLAEKPNVAETKGEMVRIPSRVPSKADLLSARPAESKSARTPIAPSADAVSALATDSANSPAAENSVGQDEGSADAPRRSSNLPSSREPLTPPAVDAPAVDALAVKGSIPATHARSIVPGEIGTAREASNSGEPQSVDARGAKGVPVTQPDGRGRSETSARGDRDANRDATGRDPADHTPDIARPNLSHLFVERAESGEWTAGPSQPVRASVAALHGTAPVLTQATLLQPLTAASSDAPAAATPAPAPDTADRIVQSLKLQVQRGGGDAVLHLEPEHLGPVAISLRVENGAVSAVITAEHPAVVEWLQSNHQSLRDGLQASGLNLERFVVQRDGQSPSDRQRREWVESRRRDFRRRTPQTDSTFEISV